MGTYTVQLRPKSGSLKEQGPTRSASTLEDGTSKAPPTTVGKDAVVPTTSGEASSGKEGKPTQPLPTSEERTVKAPPALVSQDAAVPSTSGAALADKKQPKTAAAEECKKPPAKPGLKRGKAIKPPSQDPEGKKLRKTGRQEPKGAQRPKGAGLSHGRK